MSSSVISLSPRIATKYRYNYNVPVLCITFSSPSTGSAKVAPFVVRIAQPIIIVIISTMASSSSSSALAHAMSEIVHHLPALLHDVPDALQELVWSAVVPALLLLAALALAGTAAQRLHRRLYPPGSAELHKEAIALLVHTATTTTTTTSTAARHRKSSAAKKNRAYQQAVKLLRQAAEFQPNNSSVATAESSLQDSPSQYVYYAPAVLSLAALYIYTLHDGASAVQLLESTLLRRPSAASAGCAATSEGSVVAAHNVADAKSLLFDAQALLAGHGHMIQAEIRRDEFLSLSYCCSSSTTTATTAAAATSAPPDTTTTVDSKKKQ